MILYTSLVHQAIRDMAQTVPALRHVDARRVAVVAAARVSAKRYGNLAQCYALREPESANLSYWYHPRDRRVVRATSWFRHENTRVTLHGAEMLYVILLRLPRLLEHDPLETIVHELIHVSPDFDGRSHRLPHGKRFNRLVEGCVRDWRREGDTRLAEALEMNFEALNARWGSLTGQSFASPFVSPRVRPVPDPPPLESHPDFRRKRLKCDPAAVEIVPPKWTPDSVPARLTERELVYRVYAARSARRISTAAVRAAKPAFADENGRPKAPDPHCAPAGPL